MNKVGFVKECWLKLQGYKKLPCGKDGYKYTRQTKTGSTTLLPSGNVQNIRKTESNSTLIELVRPDGTMRVTQKDIPYGPYFIPCKGSYKAMEYPAYYNSGTKRNPAYISDDKGTVIREKSPNEVIKDRQEAKKTVDELLKNRLKNYPTFIR